MKTTMLLLKVVFAIAVFAWEYLIIGAGAFLLTDNLPLTRAESLSFISAIVIPMAIALLVFSGSRLTGRSEVASR